ncbi:MAG: methyltransferase domain-containing protein, partial [Planctomycetota bacterium]
RIQDLKLSLDAAQAWLDEHPATDIDGVAAFEAECDRLRAEQPLIEDNSVDVIVSNCVLNLVSTEKKKQLFNEMFRVLRKGGRCVISDIVCDEPPTERIMKDAKLWSGCISGAFLEEEFLQMFADAGFHGIEVLKFESEPWHTIDGIEFRSMTVRAYKGKQGPCKERKQAVMYKGPWSRINDDDGHVFARGARVAVCDKTFKILTDPNGPYAGQFEAIEPLEEVPLEDAEPFNCKRTVKRSPRETKGEDYDVTVEASAEQCCGPEGCC